MSRINAALIAKLNDKETEEYIQRWEAIKDVREDVCSILTKELDNVTKKLLSEDVLDSPNALSKLSKQFGYAEGIKFCLKLLNFSD